MLFTRACKVEHRIPISVELTADVFGNLFYPKYDSLKYKDILVVCSCRAREREHYTHLGRITLQTAEVPFCCV